MKKLALLLLATSSIAFADTIPAQNKNAIYEITVTKGDQTQRVSAQVCGDQPMVIKDTALTPIRVGSACEMIPVGVTFKIEPKEQETFFHVRLTDLVNGHVITRESDMRMTADTLEMDIPESKSTQITKWLCFKRSRTSLLPKMSIKLQRTEI